MISGRQTTNNRQLSQFPPKLGSLVYDKGDLGEGTSYAVQTFRPLLGYKKFTQKKGGGWKRGGRRRKWSIYRSCDSMYFRESVGFLTFAMVTRMLPRQGSREPHHHLWSLFSLDPVYVSSKELVKSGGFLAVLLPSTTHLKHNMKAVGSCKIYLAWWVWQVTSPAHWCQWDHATTVNYTSVLRLQLVISLHNSLSAGKQKKQPKRKIP